jgi:branched-chain amino acid transport system substrate-binding protein
MLDGKFLASVASGSQNPKIAIGCACVVVAVSAPQERFSSRYVDRYGVLPTYFSFEAYDATRLLLQGIDDGATTRAELNAWLDDVQYQGVSQQIAFDRRGEAKAPVFTIFGINGDQYRPVGRVNGGKVERLTTTK